MSTWLFDLGNTRLKCAPCDAPADGHAVPHHEALDTDALHAALDAVLPPRIGTAYVASVAAPGLRTTLLDALTRRCRRIECVRTPARHGPLRMAYADPSKLGVDRFLAMLGARALGAGNVLVCGVGTALTIDLLAADGTHHGGLIAPSPELMRESLHARAPHLPRNGGQWQAFACDTQDALASGTLGAAAALVRQARSDAASRLHGAVPTWLHGGGAGALQAGLPDAVLQPHLVLHGLAAWAADTIAA